MPSENSELWRRARRARDELAQRCLEYEDVSLIDIAYAAAQDDEPEQIVLRIHVRDGWMNAMPQERVAFPEQVDGFPVIVVPGQYHLS